MDNGIEARVENLENKLEELEKSIIKLKEEEKELLTYIMNKGGSGIPIEEQELLDTLEDQIIGVDAERKSIIIDKILTEKNIKIFLSLNHSSEKDETAIRTIIDELVVNIQNKNVDERYIEFLEAAKKCSAIVEDPSTFTMVVLDNGKTYAYAEGKANVYTYDNGKIETLNLTNKIGELSYEVLNNNDYIRLVLFSYSTDEDLTDEKVKIITKRTSREELIKELI